MVAYPAVNLRIRDPYSFPVVLRVSLTGGTLRAEVLGPKRARDVTFLRVVDKVAPFAKTELPDPMLPRGARQLVERGAAGYDLTVFRLIEEGPNSTREETHERYAPRPEVIRLGVGDGIAPPAAQPPRDAEAALEEVLRISQGPHVTVPPAKALAAAPTAKPSVRAASPHAGTD